MRVLTRSAVETSEGRQRQWNIWIT